MAEQTKSTFVCSCFFTNNIFLKKYKLHVTFHDRSQFMEDYVKALRNKGCVTEQQFENVLSEIENEISRRKQLGENSLQRRKEIEEKYVPLRKEVYSLKDDYLDPAFLSIVSEAKRSDACAAKLLEKINEVGDEIYTFPVFNQEFCQMLLEELGNIEASDCPKGRPNTMNEFGVLLDEYQFNKNLLDPLRDKYLVPITSLLFPAWGGDRIDSHKTFTVSYEKGHDLELSCHYDNAEVTLNVALSHDHSGGELFFKGMYGEERDNSIRQQTYSYGHCQGWGVLHRGQHLHGAKQLTNGKRCNLIMWMRASCVRNQRCPMCWQEPKLLHMPGMDDGFRGQADGSRVQEDGAGAAEQQTVGFCETL